MFECTEASQSTLPAHTTCDVAIVGYGPVGMTFAALLAQYGLKVIVVERFPQRYAQSRAGHFDGETMRTFQRIGIAESIELIARPMLQWSFVTAEMEILANIKLGEGGAGWKDSYLSYQPEIEEVFDARARELGVRVYMGMTAEKLQQNTDSATLTVYPSDDSAADRHTIQASYVIGADGARSFVRTAIGVERQNLGFKALDELVIDFRHHDPDRDLPQLPEVYQVLDVERPLLAGRWSGSHVSRFEFAARPGETREFLEDTDTVWKLLSKWNITEADGTIDRHAVYSFESTLAESWRVGRVLLTGDAAHTMPPFMGQGLCSGIRDAMNLAWKIAAVLDGEADDTLLDTYETERAPHARALIEMSMAVGQMVLLRDPEAGRQRDEMLRSGNLPRPPVFPRLGKGVVAEADAPDGAGANGRPSLQARVAFNGRVDRLDQFSPGKWKIVSRHPVAEALFDDRQRTLLSQLNVEMVHVSRGPGPDYYIDIDGEYDLWFRNNRLKAFLQRPDNYVFGSVQSVDELPALLDDLADALAVNGWRGVALPALNS